MSARQRQLWATVVVIVPALGTLYALVLAAQPSRVDLVLFALFYVCTQLGITAGYHRLFSHRSFQAHPSVRWALALLGAMALQGPISWWAAIHRRHHGHADREHDPHSPHEAGVTTLRGLWHAHVGWMLAPVAAERRKFARDLLQDSVVTKVDRAYGLIAIASLAVPALIGALAGGSIESAASAALWGGLVRVFATQHATWAINSVGHWLGSKPSQTRDRSVNNLVLAITTLGEGWHHNHHEKPRAARHGVRWWQLDFTWLAIAAMARLGLVTGVRRG